MNTAKMKTNGGVLLPVKGTRHPRWFKVAGDYMAPAITDGTQVSIDTGAPIKSGDLVVLLVKGQYLVRRYFITGRNSVELRTENEAARIKPLKLSGGEYEFVGRVSWRCVPA